VLAIHPSAEQHHPDPQHAAADRARLAEEHVSRLTRGCERFSAGKLVVLDGVSVHRNL
jgi:hypothetical protein